MTEYILNNKHESEFKWTTPFLMGATLGATQRLSGYPFLPLPVATNLMMGVFLKPSDRRMMLCYAAGAALAHADVIGLAAYEILRNIF